MAPEHAIKLFLHWLVHHRPYRGYESFYGVARSSMGEFIDSMIQLVSRLTNQEYV